MGPPSALPCMQTPLTLPSRCLPCTLPQAAFVLVNCLTKVPGLILVLQVRTAAPMPCKLCLASAALCSVCACAWLDFGSMCPCVTRPALPAAESSLCLTSRRQGMLMSLLPNGKATHVPHHSVDVHACGSCSQDMLISFLPHAEATYFHPPKLAYLIRTGGWLNLLSLQSGCLGLPGIGTVCCRRPMCLMRCGTLL